MSVRFLVSLLIISFFTNINTITARPLEAIFDDIDNNNGSQALWAEEIYNEAYLQFEEINESYVDKNCIQNVAQFVKYFISHVYSFYNSQYLELGDKRATFVERYTSLIEFMLQKPEWKLFTKSKKKKKRAIVATSLAVAYYACIKCAPGIAIDLQLQSLRSVIVDNCGYDFFMDVVYIYAIKAYEITWEFLNPGDKFSEHYAASNVDNNDIVLRAVTVLDRLKKDKKLWEK